MENLALLNLLERVLGKSKNTSNGNHAFYCPNHCHPTKHKLEINTETQYWSCWICGSKNGFKGRTISSLFRKIQASPEYYSELKLILPNTKISHTDIKHDVIKLPDEFIPLYNLPDTLDKIQKIYIKQAWNYLKKRHISPDDLIKYNIGICLEGKYANRIIIPSYDEYFRINYFIARDFTGTQASYKNPLQHVKDIIPFEGYINWDVPIILCEGIFDALSIKRNVIPLFGKVIHDPLLKKILQSQCKKVYIALDKDAIKDSLQYVKKFMDYGIETYLVELDGKDASELGFEHMIEILSNTYPMTFEKLMKKRLEKL